MSSNDSNILTNFDLPFISHDLPPPKLNLNFNTLPRVLQERFIEIATTSQIMKLRRTSSYCSKLAKKYHGKHPVDRLEIRELQPGGPIHFNQFRYVVSKKQVEYIANPLWDTYDPDFLQKLNVKKELAFTSVTLKVIDEVMDFINYSNITSLEIRCNITWKNLKKLNTDKIRNFLFDGEIVGDVTFKEFLDFIQNIDYVYAKVNMDLPLNDDRIFMEWMETQQQSKKLQLFVIQTPPRPMKMFNSNLLQ
jgi:hypothetical protein